MTAILFYPQVTIGKLTGSPGGKTGSPMDNSDCTSCHSVLNTSLTTTNITSNIPSTGYIPGNTYNITVVLNPVVGLDPAGFEITCEENTTNTKSGSFGITNPTSTQFTNNSSAVTHTTAGNSLGTWSFNWVAPIAETGDITFYGAFIEADYPIGNQGDLFNEATLSINESTVNSTINPSEENSFTFNSVNNTIELLDNTELSVYNLEGRLILYSNKRHTNLSHLLKGIYIIKTDNNSQKIFIH